MTTLLIILFIASFSNALEIPVSPTVSIEFYTPQIIYTTEWPDKFVSVENNFIAGDLGSYTFIANTSIQSGGSTTWTNAYTHSTTTPAISYAFRINDTTITNLGSFPAIPVNTTITHTTSSNYDQFYEKSATSLGTIEFNAAEMTWTGLPYGISDSKFAKGLRFGGVDNVRLNDGSYLQTVIVYWGGNPNYAYSTSIVSFRSTDLKNWEFLSIIANASQYPSSEEGPNEHDISYLADGKTLYALIRMDAGDGPTTHSYKYYMESMSMDNGKTWSKLEYVQGMGCARPRLRMFEGLGVMVASGGRMRNDDTSDILMWINSDGMAMKWDKMISISFVHNQLWDGEVMYLYDANVNSTTYSPRETNSYTSLIQYEPDKGYGVITYDQIKMDGANEVPVSFAMDFLIKLSA